MDKKKSPEWSGSTGLQLPREIRPTKGPGAILARAGNVATGALQTDTPEFKRWFGDSKVVDADGKPLAVYSRAWLLLNRAPEIFMPNSTINPKIGIVVLK